MEGILKPEVIIYKMYVYVYISKKRQEFCFLKSPCVSLNFKSKDKDTCTHTNKIELPFVLSTN